MASKQAQQAIVVETRDAPANDPSGPVRLIINDGQKVPHLLEWQPDEGFSHLATVWGLMMVLRRGNYVEGLRLTSWKKADAKGKAVAMGVCSLLTRTDQGPRLAPGETLTFGAVLKGSPASRAANDA
ncbi:MAG: hypothetical protein EPN91_06585 [Salinibacterium sp.]|nr:MAG: hypothetical protein EPN91_06585 [Salinibacterium sp.]